MRSAVKKMQGFVLGARKHIFAARSAKRLLGQSIRRCAKPHGANDDARIKVAVHIIFVRKVLFLD